MVKQRHGQTKKTSVKVTKLELEKTMAINKFDAFADDSKNDAGALTESQGFEADELSDDDLEQVAGGWTGDDTGGGDGGEGGGG